MKAGIQAAEHQRLETAVRRAMLGKQGSAMAAEQFTCVQMVELRNNTHSSHRACVLVPGVEFIDAEEWRAFCLGVCEAMALVKNVTNDRPRIST